MSQLVPCPSCGRHVRLSSASCPFCDGALDASALGERYAPRRDAMQPGLRRAAMFTIGAGLAAACSDDSSVQPVYGAPVASESASSTVDEPTSTDDQPSVQPLYGAPIDTTTAEPSAQPVYGAPIIPDGGISVDAAVGDVDAAVGDGGAEATAVDAGDGGLLDASTPDEPTIDPDPDPGPTVVPLYGAPPINQN